MLFANSAFSQALSDQIVAVVNDDVITAKELKSRLQLLQAQKRIPSKLNPQIEQQVLVTMSEELVLKQRAEKLGISVSDIESKRLLSQFARQQGLNLTQLKRGLASQRISYESFQDQLETNRLIQKLVRREALRNVSVGQQELDEFIRANNIQPRAVKYDLTHLMINEEGVENVDQDQLRDKVQSAIGNINNQPEAANVAKVLRNAGFSVKSRDLNSQTPRQLPTLFANQLSLMNKGEMSDVLTSSAGAHLIFLRAVKGEGNVSERRKAQHILVEARSKLEIARATKVIERLSAQIAQGEDFASLAKFYSDDANSAAVGGDLGWVRKGQMVPEFEQALFSMKEGQVSEPVISSYGVHLIKLNEISVSSDPQEEVRDIAFNALMNQKVDQFYPVWLSQLVGQSYIKYL